MNISVYDALQMVGKTKFERFTELDYQAFSGVVSDNPLIGQYLWWTIVIDGDYIEFTNSDTMETQQFYIRSI